MHDCGLVEDVVYGEGLETWPHYWEAGATRCCKTRHQALILGHQACITSLFAANPREAFFAAFAAYHKRYTVLRELFSAAYPMDHRVVEWAALSNGAYIIEWAVREAGLPITPLAMQLAAGAGHVACIRAMHELGAAWSVHIVAYAAEARQMPVLRYMLGDHPRDCPVKACQEMQRLESTEYKCFCNRPQVDRNIRFTCPVDSCAMLMAARKGHLDVIQYLYDMHVPWTAVVTRTLARAVPHHSFVSAYPRYFACFQFAMEHGAPSTGTGACPWMYEFCEAHNCTYCPRMFNTQPHVRRLLLEWVPLDLNDLICEFACEQWYVYRAWNRQQRVERIAMGYTM